MKRKERLKYSEELIKYIDEKYSDLSDNDKKGICNDAYYHYLDPKYRWLKLDGDSVGLDD